MGVMEPVVLESCHSTWIFDAEKMRFRRVVKGAISGTEPVLTGWRPYSRLLLDPRSERFTVLLNTTGTRLLRSWRHTEACAQCGGQQTTELSLDALRQALAS
jgi:hypothetical protein